MNRSGLDAKVRKELRAALREIQDRLGITSIFVTHDREEAFALADKVAILNDGKIAQFDSPGLITESPADAFVRGFELLRSWRRPGHREVPNHSA
ncbi:MAG: hypothetical protein IPN48_11720 [Sphingomonadales bacterium]|nr:hypothetical protein [Sphingomonadales bacterium]